jgi:hypothetical protein
LTQRVEAALGRPYSRYAPARHLSAHVDELLPSIPDKTLDRFEALCTRLNDRLPG